MMRVEAVIFASAEPVSREILARVIGEDRSIDLLIDDLREELRDRPYELVRLPEAGSTEPVRVALTWVLHRMTTMGLFHKAADGATSLQTAIAAARISR